jgi:glucuronate isomerase
MAKPFMDEEFLLGTPTARKLHHEYAAPQPIIDYHCHLPPAEIAHNRRFGNMTELWLGGDHHKWRFMRSSGKRDSRPGDRCCARECACAARPTTRSTTSRTTGRSRRNVTRALNARMHSRLGPDTGWDSIGDDFVAAKLGRYLDALDRDDLLPRTILYCLNPAQNEVLGTMIGNFQDGRVVGKMQFGSGWWFNDRKDGMIRQLTALANLGNLGAFVGMLTDSRSFLSYPRHEHFRRILCNLIGDWVENGEYPTDWPQLRRVVEGICCGNAERYLVQ